MQADCAYCCPANILLPPPTTPHNRPDPPSPGHPTAPHVRQVFGRPVYRGVYTVSVEQRQSKTGNEADMHLLGKWRHRVQAFRHRGMCNFSNEIVK